MTQSFINLLIFNIGKSFEIIKLKYGFVDVNKKLYKYL